MVGIRKIIGQLSKKPFFVWTCEKGYICTRHMPRTLWGESAGIFLCPFFSGVLCIPLAINAMQRICTICFISTVFLVKRKMVLVKCLSFYLHIDVFALDSCVLYLNIIQKFHLRYCGQKEKNPTCLSKLIFNVWGIHQ